LSWTTNLNYYIGTMDNDFNCFRYMLAAALDG